MSGVIGTEFAEFTGDVAAASIVCFAAGTRIATMRGQVAIERLRVGDIIRLADGGVQPALWIGQVEIAITRHPHPGTVRPVLIRAGAFSDGVPLRDLRVSPDHGMLFGDVLVPAAMLVNGATILQEPFWETITYWHVEVPEHAILLAEGAPAESYLDDGGRAAFDHAGIAAQFIDFAVRREAGLSTTLPCRPVLRDAARSAPFRRHLAARARRLGADTVGDPGLRLIVGGAVLPFAGASVSLNAAEAAIARAQGAVLASRISLATAAAGMMRGVGLAGLVLRGGAELLRLPAEDMRLRGARGLGPLEGGLRWTDGQAWLPGAVFAAMSPGEVTVDAILAPGGEYWRLEEARDSLPRAENA
ncbi:Hint domain-containing protein [Plastoroseomonas arctica]|uniref:Hint domain-containing protein n=1 Tax=Plastoroseomonas arctica TaxID=1509237 RepID=A0AAF1JZJ5_9PROT|nr:Hint domain-containing protein [Plastoroseomonas arctica]MBR0656896.1 Hint domain-containing protein [Plastoroseomonas arctica]